MTYIKGTVCGQYMYVTTYQHTPYNYGKPKPQRKDIKTIDFRSFRPEVPNVLNVGETKSTSRRIDSIRRTQRALHRVILSNEPRPETTLFITLTYKENFTNHNLSRAHFKSFYQKLTYKYGKEIRLITVLEYQSRGAIHYHCLCWGISKPETVSEWQFLKRDFEKIWSHGYVKIKSTYGNASSISYYLSSYLTKESQCLRPSKSRIYTLSENCRRPSSWLITDTENKDVPEITFNNSPLFTTQIVNDRLGFIDINIFKICNSQKPVPLSQSTSLLSLIREKSHISSFLSLMEVLSPMYLLRQKRIYQGLKG